MIIKNYSNPKGPAVPAANLQIIEDVTDVYVHACCFNPQSTGNTDESGPTTFYGTEDQPMNVLTRHIDFTRYGVRSRLVVSNHAYICSNEGKTIEKVSA